MTAVSAAQADPSSMGRAEGFGAWVGAGVVALGLVGVGVPAGARAGQPSVSAGRAARPVLVTGGAEEWERQAAAVEDDLSFEFGPPLPVKPGHELVGDLLMDVRRPGEAVVAYESALKRYPGRALALLGLYRAANASRQPQKAQQAAADLRKIWQRADKTLPELREIAAVPPPSS